MKLKHRKQQEKKHRSGEIPTGSFSDIAFLLIIYFLLATTLVKIKSITADVPTGQTNDQAQVDKTPTVVLRGADIYFNDKPTTITALNDALSGMYLDQKPPDKRVVLLESADQTSYDTYFSAIEAITANGGVIALSEEDK